MNDLLKKISKVAHGVKDAIEHAQTVKEQVEALTDTQYMCLARKLNIDWRCGGTNSIMMRDLADVKEKLGEVTDDDTQ